MNYSFLLETGQKLDFDGKKRRNYGNKLYLCSFLFDSSFLWRYILIMYHVLEAIFTYATLIIMC